MGEVTALTRIFAVAKYIIKKKIRKENLFDSIAKELIMFRNN